MVESRPNVWQLQSRHDKQGLLGALRYPDPEVRGRAAAALRTLNAVDTVPALKEALRVETDEQARRNMTVALHVLDRRTDVHTIVKSEDVERLINVLKSRHPDHVILAAKALGALGDRLAVEPLVILFQNPSSPPAVRLAAAEALLELKSAPAVVTLLGALRRDSWEVRRNAAAVLGQIQATWAVEPLAAALDDPHPVVRRTAAAALNRIGTAEAVAALRTRIAPQPPPPAAKASAAKAGAAGFKSPPPPESSQPPEAKETSAAVPHDTRPAEARVSISEENTRPVSAIPPALPAAAPKAAQPAPPTSERPTQPEAPVRPKPSPTLNSPVQKLIAFLKRRGEDKA